MHLAKKSTRIMLWPSLQQEVEPSLAAEQESAVALLMRSVSYQEADQALVVLLSTSFQADCGLQDQPGLRVPRRILTGAFYGPGGAPTRSDCGLSAMKGDFLLNGLRAGSVLRRVPEEAAPAGVIRLRSRLRPSPRTSTATVELAPA